MNLEFVKLFSLEMKALLRFFIVITVRELNENFVVFFKEETGN